MDSIGQSSRYDLNGFLLVIFVDSQLNTLESCMLWFKGFYVIIILFIYFCSEAIRICCLYTSLVLNSVLRYHIWSLSETEISLKFKQNWDIHLNFRYRACFGQGVLDIQATTECRFILKRVRDMIKTYSQMHRTNKYSQHTAQSFCQFS